MPPSSLPLDYWNGLQFTPTHSILSPIAARAKSCLTYSYLWLPAPLCSTWVHPPFLHSSPGLQYLLTYLSPLISFEMFEAQVMYLVSFPTTSLQHLPKGRPLINYEELADRQDCFDNVICLTSASSMVLRRKKMNSLTENYSSTVASWYQIKLGCFHLLTF